VKERKIEVFATASLCRSHERSTALSPVRQEFGTSRTPVAPVSGVVSGKGCFIASRAYLAIVANIRSLDRRNFG